MATNEQVIDRVDRFELSIKDMLGALETRIMNVSAESKERAQESKVRDRELTEKFEHLDTDMRGNGDVGIKAQVKENTKKLDKIDKYFFAIVLLIIGDIVTRISGLI